MSQQVASWYLLDNNLPRNANKFNLKILQSYLICWRYFTSITAILWIKIIARNFLSKHFISISALKKKRRTFCICLCVYHRGWMGKKTILSIYVIMSVYFSECAKQGYFIIFYEVLLTCLVILLCMSGWRLKNVGMGVIIYRITFRKFLNQFQGFHG